jgi:hypothetical protein
MLIPYGFEITLPESVAVLAIWREPQTGQQSARQIGIAPTDEQAEYLEAVLDWISTGRRPEWAERPDPQ